jgi:hypothetical protein
LYLIVFISHIRNQQGVPAYRYIFNYKIAGLVCALQVEFEFPAKQWKPPPVAFLQSGRLRFPGWFVGEWVATESIAVNKEEIASNGT